MKRFPILRWLFVLLIVGILIAGFASPNFREYAMHRVQAWLDAVRSLGPWGPVALAVTYIVASVLAFPGLPLSLGAGFLFGPVEGTVAASIGSTFGAAAAFLVGRNLARRAVEARIAGNPKFLAIDRAVAAQGFRIVLLIRLAPVFPFNAMNYAFGLTKVRFRDYFFASWIGMFPATAVNVYLGSLLGDLAELGTQPEEGKWLRQVFLIVGLVAALVASLYVTHVARTALARAAPEVEAKPAETEGFGS